MSDVTVDGKENLELKCNSPGKFCSLAWNRQSELPLLDKKSRIYTVVEKREIATADLIATDAASHRAHADGGSTSRTTFKSNYFLDDFINQRKHP
ncbi:hypothetical protein EMCRGX_G007930 [Ephydatia muelleri]